MLLVGTASTPRILLAPSATLACSSGTSSNQTGTSAPSSGTDEICRWLDKHKWSYLAIHSKAESSWIAHHKQHPCFELCCIDVPLPLFLITHKPHNQDNQAYNIQQPNNNTQLQKWLHNACKQTGCLCQTSQFSMEIPWTGCCGKVHLKQWSSQFKRENLEHPTVSVWSTKKIVEGYQFVQSPNAYTESKSILEKRFGHPSVVMEGFRNKLENWQRIPPKDVVASREFADFLKACEMAIKSIEDMETQ